MYRRLLLHRANLVIVGIFTNLVPVVIKHTAVGVRGFFMWGVQLSSALGICGFISHASILVRHGTYIRNNISDVMYTHMSGDPSPPFPSQYVFLFIFRVPSSSLTSTPFFFEVTML